MGKIRKFLKILGPGFVTGASDDDPSGIATYSQTGAQFGYSQLWTALFTYPFMVAVQEMCGRIGTVTGRGLAVVIRENYSKKILYFCVFLLLVANTVNIGADLGAMASAGQLLLDFPFIGWLFVMTLVTIFLEVFVSYKTYARYLKYLTFSLFAYFISAFVIGQDWGQVLYLTFVPHLSFTREYVLNLVAILGTTISPYLYFWQTDEVVEEEVAHGQLKAMDEGKPKFGKRSLENMRLDTVFGMLFSNLVMLFIILVSASTLGAQGISNIETAAQAAEALKPLAGDFTFLLFAAGILGSGLLAVPILAGSASYALAETFGWKEGLSRKFSQAHGFYIVIIIATLIGLLVNFTPIKPFKMLYYTAILNGICAPILLAVILMISNNKKILGEYVNTPVSNILGGIITLVMAVAAITLLVSFIF